MTIALRNRVVAFVRTLSILLLALAAPAALASIGEIDITYPYSPLGPLGLPIKGMSTAGGHGLGSLKLTGWTFPMGGQQFNQFMIGADGFMTVGNGQSVCNCTASAGTDNSCYPECPSRPPQGGEEIEFSCGPNCEEYQEVWSPVFGPGLIAPLYSSFYTGDYNESTVPIGDISYFQGGPVGAHYLIVDWNGVGTTQDYYGCTDTACDSTGDTQLNFTYQFQAILFESGAIVFNYGQGFGGPISFQYSQGQYETVQDYNTQSIIGVFFPPPDAGMSRSDAGPWLGPSAIEQNQCMLNFERYSGGCEWNNGLWSSLNSAYMGETSTPFLTSTPAPSASLDANGKPQINLSVTLFNQGQKKAPGDFPVNFFLVQQGIPPFDLPDTCVTGSASNGCLGQLTFQDPVAPGGQSSASLDPIPLPSPLPARGYYAVATTVDPANTTIGATAPLLEIGASTKLLGFGQDLTGKVEVTNFSAVNPTEFTVPIQFSNLGLEDCITANYSLDFVSSDGVTITNGATGTVNGIGALATVTKKQVVPIPSGLQAGTYHLRLSIDNGLPDDLDPTNNVVSGIQPVENGQDMTATIAAVPFSIPSPATFQVPVIFHNLGLQTASQVQWQLTLNSADGATSAEVGGDVVATVPGLSDLPEDLTATIQQALPPGAYTLTLAITGAASSTPDLNGANNLVVDPTPIFVYASTADYGISSSDIVMNASTHIDDGQVVSVSRTIHNLQGPAGACPYSYYLNPLSVTQIGDGVPVAILGPNGPTYTGTIPPFAAFGQSGDRNTATDQIVIPDGMPPGTYNLVLALTPSNDTNPVNNDAAISISVAANPLQITSPSSLTAGIVDTPYTYQLTESGGGTNPTWSLLAGALPDGLGMSSKGLISGTPTKAGVYNLVVQLSALGGTQVAILQLPVASGAGALQVELSGSALPTAIAGSSYIQTLKAQGGVPPYGWKATIPISLNLSISPNGGVLSGTPAEPTPGPIQFTVVVSDSIGTQASATMTLQVIAPGQLTITTPFLEPAVVGTAYDQPILAADGNVTGATFIWSQPNGTTLPTGLKFAQIGTPAVADISGTPTEAGIFPLVVNLSDNFGHTATRQYILTVTLAPVPLPQHQTLPPAVVGADYTAQLQANSLSTVSWRIFSGQLPPGIALAPTGAISGSVPSGTTLGTYPFAAAVTDSNGAESVIALAIQVQDPAASGGGGCASGGGSAGAVMVLLGLFWLSRRREDRSNS